MPEVDYPRSLVDTEAPEEPSQPLPDLESAIARLELLADLMRHDGWNVLLEDYATMRTRLISSLMSSQTEDMGQVQSIRGQLRMVERLLHLPDAVSKGLASLQEARGPRQEEETSE